MTKRQRLGQLGLMLAGAGIAILAYEAGRARAGVPATQALVYTGFLTDDTGAPITGEVTIAVDLFGSNAAGDDKPLCKTTSQKVDLGATAGRFSLVLEDDCSAKVQEDMVEPWVEVRVDGNAMERTKIGAVPYALAATKLAPAAIQDIKVQIKEELKKDLATAQLAYPDCPPGYSKANDDGVAWAEHTLCIKGDPKSPYDQVVKVGEGATSFWIDRYEATIWTMPDGPVSGQAKFTWGSADIPNFPKNGEYDVPLFALSPYVFDFPAADMTWFQANQACAASGKRLPTSREWLLAAKGTKDPGSNNGLSNPGCHTDGPNPRFIGGGIDTADASCVSVWGAEDMIGNLREWVADWHVSAGQVDTDGGTGEVQDKHVQVPWPAAYNDDATVNVDSTLEVGRVNGLVVGQTGLPAAEMKGGAYTDGTKAGLFYVAVSAAPSFNSSDTGFRCMIPR